MDFPWSSRQAEHEHGQASLYLLLVLWVLLLMMMMMMMTTIMMMMMVLLMMMMAMVVIVVMPSDAAAGDPYPQHRPGKGLDSGGHGCSLDSIPYIL